MGGWLAPLRAALDEAGEPAAFFFRDDDAGWNDARLFALLEVFERHAMPLDLAVIPRALTQSLALTLRARARAWEGRLGLHQHGLAHVNHEPEGGKKSEFGPARDAAAQRRDVAAGAELLAAALPALAQPIFTPPWNRCTAATGGLLADLGFAVLSRSASAAPLGLAGLREVPVSVDWSYATRSGARLRPLELAELAAARVRSHGPIGVNLHHAVMDERELELIDELLGLIAAHAMASARPLLAVGRP